ncbi:hypothetical protein NHF50_10495 [Flavobacterium sp. NRK F10]|uniref:Peptidylprolyl isomerase n=1 Tax=Flavobacterium sediminis TaxID=2201181 RepID=A0A2U8QW53_9FLAO|nr:MULTISPECIES: hypothetical protein [Flavobacterium]AWM14271.1 hypothetical protein DI487_10670 [Flavobacterium sediminis]MCO6175472.1 hypothetical protein [Flavobacterium sp. NRK F10]
MKRIVMLVVLVFGFSLFSTAQESKKDSYTEKAKVESMEISKFLNVTDQSISDEITNVLAYKNEEMGENSPFGEERKIIFARHIETKLSALLTKEQLEKLKANKKLYNKAVGLE